MPTFLSADELTRTRGLEGFAAYQRRAVDVWRAPATDDPILATSLRDLGRVVSGLWALFLHCTPGGITLVRLSDLLVLAGVSGRGRARSMLIYLRFIGYIEPDPAPGDGRVKRFRPTARMTQAFRVRYRHEFEAAAPLDPCFTAALARLDDEVFFAAMMASLGDLSLAGIPLVVENGPSLHVISHRFAGMMLIAELLALADRDGGAFPPVGPLSFSMAAISRTCGISRTQARRILQAGADSGFLELTGESELVLTPQLAEHVSLLIACSFRMFQWACIQALTSALYSTQPPSTSPTPV